MRSREAGVLAASVAEAVASGEVKARGRFTRRCELALRRLVDGRQVTMVGSCTAALEMSAILLEVGPGDEVIVPSFTFPSTANAFVLRGATPVFVDIDPRTMNIDPAAVAAAVTPRTRAIVAMHYAGVAADLDALEEIALGAGVHLIEDAAHAICATYRGRALGSIGALGSLSFDATKNLSAGTGGALVVNDQRFVARAETIRDYGTDRASFDRGEISRYCWVDVGSNFAINELAAAYLAPQLEDARALTAERRATWEAYHDALAAIEQSGRLLRPFVPDGCEHNAHVYAFRVEHAEDRGRVIAALRDRGVGAAFHYVPLHSAPAGRKYGRVATAMRHTDEASACLVRLPLSSGLDGEDVAHVIASVHDVFATTRHAA